MNTLNMPEKINTMPETFVFDQTAKFVNFMLINIKHLADFRGIKR